MRSADVFLSLEGRLDRERWLGAAALFVTLTVATYAATWALARQGLIGPGAREAIRAFVGVFLLVPWLTLDWKRFQDLGLSGRWALLCPGLLVAARLWDWPALAARVGPSRHEAVASALAWAQLAVAAALVYPLALRAGTAGPNRYGPDPRGCASPLPAFRGEGRAAERRGDGEGASTAELHPGSPPHPVASRHDLSPQAGRRGAPPEGC